jgi:hypothetical protein
VSPGNILVVRVGKNTSTTHCIILDIIQSTKKFTVGAVHVRFGTGNMNDVENVFSLVEDTIHLLQGAHGSLWEEEVHNRHNCGVTGDVSGGFLCYSNIEGLT